MQFVAFDCHKRYTYVVVEDEDGNVQREGRIRHYPGAFLEFLNGCEPSSPVAIETVGNWYWIVDEVEKAGCIPRLVHARKAKLMMGMVNKTDKLDAKGLNLLQRVGTLPVVWVPPGELRDKRELTRGRILLVRERTKLKNRIHSVLDKYGKRVEASDIFGVRGKEELKECLKELPENTRYVAEELLKQIEELDKAIGKIERRMREELEETEEIKLLETLPGVGFILAAVIWLEIGDVERFRGPEKLASYAGVVPRVKASGGKVRYGKMRKDVNSYLKWAYSEAASTVVKHHKKSNWEWRHVSRLYEKVKKKKGHYKAIGAVSRHLAEASYWVLKEREEYKDPAKR